MSRSMRVLAPGLRAAMLGCTLLAAPLAAQPEPGGAVEPMTAWLEQVDGRRPGRTWEGLAPVVQAMVTREAWDAGVQQAREPYAGAMTARTLKEAQTLPQPAGAPAGTYVRLAFSTRFSGGATATETVIAMHDGTRWWVAGYFIAPGERPDYSAPSGAPYTAVDVTVPTSAGHALAGTLTVPRGAAGRVPAVVLISGSGLQDRDSAIPGVEGYRFFRQIADSLGRRGIAVLRLDDRGWGASGGDVSTATTADLADDTRAAVAWLRGRAEIDPARIGLVGHSEGGIIAPMLAADDARIAAVALLAGQGWTGRRTSDYQLHRAWSAMGMSQAAMDSMKAINDPIREQQAAMIPWVRWWMDFDPVPTLRRVRAPALVLQGGTDWQVAPEQAGAIAAALREGGNRDVTVRHFPGLNHLFLSDPGGAVTPGAYARLPSREVPAEVLGALADWLAARLAVR
ncbi:MAG TPA: alpha/beta fold hydrolase [Longimicrobium sp.]|nr:alpha/beta fold hydrolase [Longimicrobium sp.]